jgi:hypothetical protein
MENKEYQAKVGKLKDLIGIELDLCDSYKTPTICANASDPKARISLVETILKICLEGNTSVQDAIDLYERTFNPNIAD